MELCDELKTMGQDVSIAVNHPDELDCYPSRNAVPIIPIASILTSRRSYDSVSYDIVHIHGLWSFVLHQVVQWSMRQKTPIIWSPHGMLAPWAMAHKRWKKILPWIIYQKADLKNATCFHATSDLEVAWIRNLGFSQPCKIVPLGTTLPTKQTQGFSLKDKGTTRIILFIGRIYPVKNLDTLIRAFQRVKFGQQPSMFNRQNWKLVLTGPDQAGHLSELSTLATSIGLKVWESNKGQGNMKGSRDSWITDELRDVILHTNADVFFTGALFESSKDFVYRIADFFALPSYTENFAGVVVDALAYGIPCVVSKNTPWKEVEDEKCGFWVENDIDGLADALLRMMSLSDEERQQMGMRGHDWVSKKYTWNSVGLKMLGVYDKILGIQKERSL